MKEILKISILIIVLIIPILVNARQTDYSLPENVQLMLPSKSGITVGWVIPADKDVKELDKESTNFCFDVDEDGNPWFGFEKNLVVNPLKGIFLKTDQPYRDFVWLDTNDFIMCTDTELGFLAKPKETKKQTESSMITMQFTPVIKLPYKKTRLCVGEGSILYLIAHNPKNGNDEVYIMQEEKKKGVIKKLFTIKDRISDVTGDGQETYVAIGNLIIKLLPEQNDLEKVFIHPTKKIVNLKYSSSAGLFYTTDTGIGFIGKNSKFEFMGAPNTQIRLKDNALFVLLDNIQGLLIIDGINKFSGLKISSEPKYEKKTQEEIKKPTEKKPVEKSIFCPNCGAKNKAGSKFCGACGENLK